MKDELEKTIDRGDFHALFTESVRQTVEKEKKEKVDRWLKYFSLLITSLTPVAIFFGTHLIAEQQKANTAILAKQQQEDARELAISNRKHAAALAFSGQYLERLKNATTIYKEIISKAEKKDVDRTEIIMMIISLEAYEDGALSFLINLRNRYKEVHPLLSLQAQNSIINITSHQINLTEMEFSGESPQNRMNMRKTKFIEYNLSNSKFENVNLFSADFTESTLIGVQFNSVDLQSATFERSNLTNASFTQESNLKRVNFKNANLHNMHIDDDCELQGAEFSLGSLLKIEGPPFSEMLKDDPGKEIYTYLLTPHLQTLKQEESRETLKKISNILGYKEPILLIEKLEERKKENAVYSASLSAMQAASP